MSVPLYYLSVYPILDTILDRISKAARVFFWSKGGNQKGINSVSWEDINLNHTIFFGGGGGLSIRNLNNFNRKDVLWVHILISKYGNYNMWTNSIPARCSWFFRCLCHNATHIKPYLWMNNINPDNTFFLFDPSYFKIPNCF